MVRITTSVTNGKFRLHVNHDFDDPDSTAGKTAPLKPQPPSRNATAKAWLEEQERRLIAATMDDDYSLDEYEEFVEQLATVQVALMGLQNELVVAKEVQG